MKVSRWGGLLGWCCLLGLVVLSSCRRDQPSGFDSNLPPDTYISFAPAESTLAYYRIQLYWNGVDPDGIVDHYEYSVTDSNETPGQNDPGFNGYYRTTRTDSLFILRADLPQIAGHRFYVRAVDNEDKVDPTPAWTYFIAHDFNFPNVVWHRSIGRWIDRSGNERTITITSNDEFNPTDTIGVGGSVEFSWGGFDVDDGGYLTGFDYKSASEVDYKGKTLADTTWSADFDPEPGEPYFSGKDVLKVRAIDDAGAATNPDSVRSWVVNHGPVAWILDAADPESAVRKPTFVDIETGNVWPSGTILADGLHDIRFHYTGFDDPRDISLDDANPTGIAGFQFRRLLNGGGIAWQNLNDWVFYPEPSDFRPAVSRNLGTGTYLFLIRAKDELGRFGSPDTVAIGINYYPFFTEVTYVDPPSGEEIPLWNFCPEPCTTPPDTVSLTIGRPVGSEEYPDLTIRWRAIDTHRPPPDKHPLDFNRVVEEEQSWVEEHRSQLNGARDGFEPVEPDAVGEKVFHVSDLDTAPAGDIREGRNRLELRAKDAGGRVTLLTVFFDVTLD